MSLSNSIDVTTLVRNDTFSNGYTVSHVQLLSGAKPSESGQTDLDSCVNSENAIPVFLDYMPASLTD